MVCTRNFKRKKKSRVNKSDNEWIKLIYVYEKTNGNENLKLNFVFDFPKNMEKWTINDQMKRKIIKIQSVSNTSKPVNQTMNGHWKTIEQKIVNDQHHLHWMEKKTEKKEQFFFLLQHRQQQINFA